MWFILGNLLPKQAKQYIHFLSHIGWVNLQSLTETVLELDKFSRKVESSLHTSKGQDRDNKFSPILFTPGNTVDTKVRKYLSTLDLSCFFYTPEVIKN